MNWLNPYQWVLYLVAVLLLVFCVWRFESHIEQRGYDRAQAEYTAAALKASEEARQREQDLQAQADKARKVKDAEITRISTQLANALDSLRNRADRPADLPQTASTNAGCTGASLFRPDAEFLARESARADGLRAALEQCQTQYNALR